MYTRIPVALLADLRANGASIVDLAALFGCSRNGVSKVIARARIPLPAPVIKVSVPRKKVARVPAQARPSASALAAANPFGI